MKKLISLFILVTTLSSCSNDDNTSQTPLEGKWHLVAVNGGDPSPDDPTNPGDIGQENIFYTFTKNQFVVNKSAEIQDSGTFTYEEKEGKPFVYFTSNIFNETSQFYITYYNEDSSVLIFNSMEIDYRFALKKTQ